MEIVNGPEAYSHVVRFCRHSPKEPESYPCAVMALTHNGMGHMEDYSTAKIVCCPDWVDDQYAFLEGVIWAWQDLFPVESVND